MFKLVVNKVLNKKKKEDEVDEGEDDRDCLENEISGIGDVSSVSESKTKEELLTATAEMPEGEGKVQSEIKESSVDKIAEKSPEGAKGQPLKSPEKVQDGSQKSKPSTPVAAKRTSPGKEKAKAPEKAPPKPVKKTKEGTTEKGKSPAKEGGVEAGGESAGDAQPATAPTPAPAPEDKPTAGDSGDSSVEKISETDEEGKAGGASETDSSTQDRPKSSLREKNSGKAGGGVATGSTKYVIRMQTWRKLDQSLVTHFPRPCTFRIPHFKGEIEAVGHLSNLDVFKNAKVIKVNLDKSQEFMRLLVMETRKEFIVGCPGLQEAVFLHVKPPVQPNKSSNRMAASRLGITHVGAALDFSSDTKADLVVLGSVAVDRTGRRIGKGEGFSDLEYALLKKLGGIVPDAPIVTLVHDLQVYEKLPEELFKSYDVPVDIIITPTEVIEVNPKREHPTLEWNMLSNRRVNEIPIIKHLMEKEQHDGVTLQLKEEDSDTEEWARRWRGRSRWESNGDGRNMMRGRGGPGRRRPRGPMSNQGMQMQPMGPPMRRRRPQMQQMMQNNYQPQMAMRRPRRMGMNSGGRRREESAPPPGGYRMDRVASQGGRPRPTRTFRRKRYTGGRATSAASTSDNLNSSQMSGQRDDNQAGDGIRQRPMNRRFRRNGLNKPRYKVDFTVRVDGLTSSVRVRDLKAALVTRGVRPADISWRGPKGVALLHFSQSRRQGDGPAGLDDIVSSLQGLKVKPQDGPEANLRVQPAIPKSRVEGQEGQTVVPPPAIAV